jgi:signal transduction histidine kinase
MRVIPKAPVRDRLRSPGFAIRIRKRNVVRAGLGIVIGLLLFSTIEAYRIQEGLSRETLEIYHRHVRQDSLLWRLRRTLWYGSNNARDFLLNPYPDRLTKFHNRLADLRTTSSELMNDLARSPDSNRGSTKLRAAIEDYWSTLAGMPAAAAHLNAAQRYDLVQNEIVARRAAVGNLVQDFTEVAHESLRLGEEELSRSRREGTSRLLWVLSFSVVVALAVAGISIAHSENLEQQAAAGYEEVEKARAELQAFAVRLMQLQEEERTRLSHELHDEIGGSLATFRLEVSRAESLLGREDTEARERLARARELAGRTVEAVRDISALLRPALLDDLGLYAALDWQVEEFTRRTRVPCQLDYLEAPESLPDAVKTCVYRVIQESLHNCEKYALASNVVIAIAQTEEALSVSIRDNGQGMAATERNGRRGGRFGILGMRQRANSLGGSLTVTSPAEGGVQVLLQLPLAHSPVTVSFNRVAEARA